MTRLLLRMLRPLVRRVDDCARDGGACRDERTGLTCTHVRLMALAFLAAMLIWGCGTSVPTVDHGGRELRLFPLRGGVNTTSDEIAPQLSPDGSILYFTSRRAADGGDDGSDKLYAATLDGINVTTVQRVGTGLGRTLSEGAPSFDHASNRVYFSQCYVEGGYGDCDLYVADIVDGQWRNVRNLGGVINSKDWDCHPAISHDGTTLYFSSERDGGLGGADIWMSVRGVDGAWTPPVNLGEPINTRGDEKTPFVADDGVTLYFASNYHDGFGGHDLFRSVRGAAGWSEPRNMGEPYNSGDDDLFLTTRGEADTVFLASDRDGGNGRHDLYGVLRQVIMPVAPPPPPTPVRPPEPLAVRYVVRNAFTGAEIDAFVALRGGSGDERMLRSQHGAGESAVIEAGADYAAVISRSGFENAEDSFTYGHGATGTQTREISLIPIVEKERVLYAFVVEFDFNFSNIRPSEKQALDSVVTLLAKYPNSTVVLSGHTDSVGTEQYNIRLGFNRAKEVGTYVERYLREKQARIMHPFETRTYGEMQPVAANETEEGRQRNRRVEISIVRNE